MVGAGVLGAALLGLEHWHGVVIVGAVVILIVVMAGMVSTTWVQFLKGALLVVFSTVLVVMILQRGFTTDQQGYAFRELGPFPTTEGFLAEGALAEADLGERLEPTGDWAKKPYVRTRKEAGERLSLGESPYRRGNLLPRRMPNHGGNFEGKQNRERLAFRG